MPEYRHPREVDGAAGIPPAAVSLRGETVPVDRDGDGPATFTSDDVAAVRALAESYGVEVQTIAVGEDGDSAQSDGDDSGTCTAVKSDGEVCGRELPCPYHDGGDD